MYWNRPNLPILSISYLQLMSARNYDAGLTYKKCDRNIIETPKESWVSLLQTLSEP